MMEFVNQNDDMKMVIDRDMIELVNQGDDIRTAVYRYQFKRAGLIRNDSQSQVLRFA